MKRPSEFLARSAIAASLLVCLGPAPKLCAQEPTKKVSVMIVGGSSLANAPLQVSTDVGRVYTVQLDTAGRGVLVVEIGGKPVTLRARLIGYSIPDRKVVTAASSSVTWNVQGPDLPRAAPSWPHLPRAMPWPVVTWRAQAGSLDIFVDGESMGSAGSSPLTRAISPNERHRFQWRDARGQVVCDTTYALPQGVTRCHACDPLSRKVTGC